MAENTRYSTELDRIAGQANRYYTEVIDPLAQKLMFSRAPDPGARKGRPMVLLVGNHSSGKSTLINYLLGEEVQNTGVAPTDDSFTVIAQGATVEEKDGDSLVSNPELGFAELRKYGPGLVSHLKLKLRESPALAGLTLIDSPGMIDSANSASDRGYDFTQVVRWFAEQADVILLMFDPDKPGTTGETLSVMRQALRDVSHKLILVLNKMDQFRNLHDFARAYGALTWNLSKVIPTKDVPLIYNIYIPGPWVHKETALPITDFDNARDQVLEEIQRAPMRRVDNILTRLFDNARYLHAHARVLNEAAAMFRRARLPWLIAITGFALIGLAVAAWLWYDVGPQAISAVLAFGIGGPVIAAILYAVSRVVLARRQTEIINGLTGIFERLHRDDYALGDEADLSALWSRIKDRVRRSIENIGLKKMPRTRRRDLLSLEKIYQDFVPTLRAEIHDNKHAVDS